MLCPLRNELYSGLDQLVANAPGYHIAPGGRVYSDHCSLRRLQQIRHRIYRNFYGNPGQVLRILTKGVRNGVLNMGTLARLPRFIVGKALRNRRRAKERARR